MQSLRAPANLSAHSLVVFLLYMPRKDVRNVFIWALSDNCFAGFLDESLVMARLDPSGDNEKLVATCARDPHDIFKLVWRARTMFAPGCKVRPQNALPQRTSQIKCCLELLQSSRGQRLCKCRQVTASILQLEGCAQPRIPALTGVQQLMHPFLIRIATASARGYSSRAGT